jgi:hypothetical protein
VRLAARDCAGDGTAEVALEDAAEVAPDATRDAVFFETVLWLSRARLRRSRMVKSLVRVLWSPYYVEGLLCFVVLGLVRLQ